MSSAAAQHVAPGSSLVIDDSTTALEMLPHLATIPQLTIVTNFVSVIDKLRDITDGSMEVIFVGGAYRPKYESFGGVLTENWLRDFRVDQCFLSVSAIDLERGAFHREADHAALRDNRAAFTARLREIGFYSDLSDAYLTQTITPRYTIGTETSRAGA